MFKISQKMGLFSALLFFVISYNDVLAQENLPPPPSTDPCEDGEEGPGSFSWSYPIGKTAYKKPDLLKTARAGATDGYRLSKNPPTFDESLSTSYFQNLSSNRSSLNLSIETVELNQAVLSAKNLKINRDSSSQVIERDGAIRQVITSDTIVEILPQAIGFHVKVYDRNATGAVEGNGLYTISPTSVPIKEMIMRTPGGVPFTDTVESVIIDRKNSGGIRVDVYRHTRNKTADTQKMSTYAGSLDSSGNVTIGPLLETNEIAFSNRGISPQTYTIVREIKRITTTPSGIQTGNLKIVSKVLEQYEDFTAGEIVKIDDAKPEISVATSSKRLVREVDGYGTPEARETRYSFYHEKDNPMINGRLKSKIESDGTWEFYSYLDKEGAAVHQQVKVSTWRDSTLNEYSGAVIGESKNETISVTPNGYEKILSYGTSIASKEIFSSTTESDGSRINTLTVKDATDTVISVRVWKLNPENAAEHLAGRIAWMENPDGTAETYVYISSPNGGFQVVHRKGAGTRNGVTSGTETTTEYNKFIQAYAETVHDITAGLNLSLWIATSVDIIGRPTRIEYNGNQDEYETFQYACCGMERKRNRNGSVTTWTRDPLKRVYLKNSYRYDGDLSPLITSYTFDGLITLSSKGGMLDREETRLLNGDTILIKTPDQDGDGSPELTAQSTSFSSSGGKVVSITYPDNGNEIQSFFKDGRLKSITGSAVPDTAYNYGYHPLGLWQQTLQLDASGNNVAWEKAYYDALDRIIKIETPATSSIHTKHWQYNSASVPAAAGSRTNLIKYTDEDGVQTYYTYDAEGELSSTSKEIANSKLLFELYSHQTVNESGLGIGKKITTTLRSGALETGIVTSEKFTSGDGYFSRSTSLGQTTTTARTPASAVGYYIVTTMHPDNTQSIDTYQGNQLIKVETKNSSGASIRWTSYTYDSLNRVATITDSRTGTSTINSYTHGGEVISQTDSGGRVTSYSYDAMGRKVSSDGPDTQDGAGNPILNITHTSWFPTGLEKAIWGDSVYASLKSYDEQGRLSNLSTYRNLPIGAEPTSTTPGADTTTWLYNSKGLLDSKKYADNTGSAYSYTSAGRLLSSRSALDVSTIYTYDKGCLTSKNYSDTTPDVIISYDDYARVSNISQFKQSNTFYVYDATSMALKNEIISYDLDHDGVDDFTRTIDRSVDSIRRNTGWQLKNGPNIENAASYGYDSSGRLSTITKDALSFGYEYLLNSDLISRTVRPDSRNIIYAWETTRDLLTNIRNVTNSPANNARYNYTYNSLGQRIQMTEQATIHTTGPATLSVWEYNERGEVTKLSSNRLGANRLYEYDSIGNRKKSSQTPTLPSFDNYSSNNLNQYEEANGHDVIYDLNGNATQYPIPSLGSISNMEWDAENRLISVSNNSDLIDYQYDTLNRRIAKTINGVTTIYIYDRWNCIAEFSYNGATAYLDRSYVWGLDISGSLQGAGGVGGLLRMTIHGVSPVDYYPSYDGNGNICEYRSNNTVAHFEYDNFGNIVFSSGNSSLFDIGFATKRKDFETGLHYYGYRYYDPVVGRWISRDPKGESAGINIYNMLNNSMINDVDYLGMQGVGEALNQSRAAQAARAAEMMDEAMGVGEIASGAKAGADAATAAAATAAALDAAAASSKAKARADAKARKIRECEEKYKNYKDAQTEYGKHPYGKAECCTDAELSRDLLQKEIDGRQDHMDSGCDKAIPTESDHAGQLAEKKKAMEGAKKMVKKLCKD